MQWLIIGILTMLLCALQDADYKAMRDWVMQDFQGRIGLYCAGSLVVVMLANWINCL